MTTEPVVISKLVNSTHSCQGVILIVDEFGSSCLDVRSCYGVNAAENLCGCHAATVSQKLSANIFRDVGMSVQSHEHGGLEVKLCSLDLFVRWRVDQADQVVHQSPHAVIDLDVWANNVDTKETSILIAGVEGTQGVGQFIFGNLLTQTGSVVLADSHGAIEGSKHDLHQHEGEGILRCPRSRFVGNRNVGGVVRVESHSETKFKFSRQNYE